MPYGPSDVPFFFVGGRDLLASVLFSFDEGTEAPMVEVHGLGPSFNGFKAYATPGVKTASLSQEGLFDDATDGVNDALNGQQMVNQIVGYGLSGVAIGKSFVGLEGAFGAKYMRSTSRTDIHRAKGEYVVKGQKDEGVILHGKTSHNAAFNTTGTSVDRAADPRLLQIPIVSSSVANPTTITTSVPHGLTTGDKVVITGHTSTPSLNGEQTATVTGPTTLTVPVNVTVGGGAAGDLVRAMSTNGGVGYLFVPSVTLGGYTSWTIKIRHSVDNVTFVDLVTFTIITTAPVALRAPVAGTVNRYLAVDASLQGAGASPAIIPVVGFARG